MDAKIMLVMVFAVGFVGGSMVLFFLLNQRWQLDVLRTDTGFLQAWVSIFQTLVVAATLGYIALQARDVEKSVRANTVQLMVTGHRELLGMIIDHPGLYDALRGSEIPEKPLTTYLSMFFNHGLNAWTLRDQDLIDDDWWSAIVRDMKDVYQKEPLKKWWGMVKQFYPTRYQIFIETEILAKSQGGAP